MGRSEKPTGTETVASCQNGIFPLAGAFNGLPIIIPQKIFHYPIANIPQMLYNELLFHLERNKVIGIDIKIL